MKPFTEMLKRSNQYQNHQSNYPVSNNYNNKQTPDDFLKALDNFFKKYVPSDRPEFTSSNGIA